jgi:hypothetical protein
MNRLISRLANGVSARAALVLVWLGVTILSASAFVDAESSFSRLQALSLPKTEGAFTLYYSPSAKDEAEIYAATLERAFAWYRARIEWPRPIVMAVLNAEDWAKVSKRIPYPSPFAELASDLVLMPDRIDSHAGFDKWDLEPVGLNAALTFHEIGHVIANQIGLWSDSYWVNELVANIFLAGYVTAERPDFAKLLDGVPPRFTDFGRYTALRDFDYIYYAMGPLNYAWFQFRLAAIARFMVEGANFGSLIGALKEAWPASQQYLQNVESAVTTLDGIRPGVAGLATDLLGESRLPLIGTQPCGPSKGSGNGVMLVIENRSDKPIRVQSPSDVEFYAGLALMTGEIETEAEMKALIEAARRDGRYATTLEPGTTLLNPMAPAGDEWQIIGGDCFVVPDEAGARFVWTGQD